MRHHKIQKSKRHKKLKSIDSLKEFNYIEDKLIDKIKDQPVPRKLVELMKQNNNNSDANKIKINKNKKEKKFRQKYNIISVKSTEPANMEMGMTRIPKQLPEKVEKGLTESDSHFMSRLNRMVSKAMAEANLENHFDVDFGGKVKDDTVTNIEDGLQNTKNVEKKKNKRKLKDLKRKAKKFKKQHKLVKQLQKLNEFSFKKDTIDLGELVHQPPNFTYLKK